MNDSDLILRAALAIHAQRQSPADIKESIATIGDSPLKVAATAYLCERPDAPLRKPLEALIRINQGGVSDLISQEFRSYLICTIALADAEILRCHEVLATFERVRLSVLKGTEDDGRIYASREDDDPENL